MMNLNPTSMREYADFLEENSNKIIAACETIEEYIQIATQCMDQESGHNAAHRMLQNLEGIKANIPTNTEACKRLVKTLKYVRDAENVFNRR